MISVVRWINKEYLVKRSVIDSNVEWAKVEPIVDLVQRKYILRLLGTDLYTNINNAIDANITSSTIIPAKYKTLIDTYLLDIIVYYTLYETSLTFKFRYTNKGVVVKDSENSQPASTDDIKLIMESWKSDAEMFANELTQFLLINTGTYPEHLTNSTNAIWAKTTSTDLDMWLGDNTTQYGIKTKNGNGWRNDPNYTGW